MVTILVDEKEWEPSDSGLGSLRELLDVLNKAVSDDFRVILEVKIDGEEIRGLDDPRVDQLDLSSLSRIEIKTENPRNLSIQILYECAKHIARISEGLGLIAEKIQSRQEQEAFSKLQEILSAWIEINEGINNALIVLGLDFQEFMVKDKSLADLQDEIRECLETCCRALEEENYLEFSDILEFDLAAKLRDMQEGIYRMITLSEKKLH